MKALTVVIVILALGDVAFDHGAVVGKIGHAGTAFVHGFARVFSDSLFAA